MLLGKKFPIRLQLDSMDCGPTCLQMIALHYGRHYSLDFLRSLCHISREGVSLLGISEAAESIGFRTLGAKISLSKFISRSSLPCIVHWNHQHFSVIFRITGKKIHVADPAHGKLVYNREEFEKGWATTTVHGIPHGICLFLEPSEEFYKKTGGKIHRSSGLNFLLKYLKPHKKFLGQLILGVFAGSILQVLFPFLTQSIIDIGIQSNNLHFIYLVLIAQLVLFMSRMSIEFIRSWILLHVSTRITISLVSDFLIKLMKLPIHFFDTKMTGDIMQRIEDHSRVERFLTSQSLSLLFSVFSLIVFSAILAYYSIIVFTIFLLGSTLYLTWVNVFMKKRRDVDYRKFSLMAGEQNNLIEIISGMQEIKLNRCERKKRWEWENIQAKIFRVNIQGLTISQYQQLGALFFNETKNILITVMASLDVLNGNMTLGSLVAIQYIIGQLNGPVDQLIEFFNMAQDARISLERLEEIHVKKNEEVSKNNKLTSFTNERSIHLQNVFFQYGGPKSHMVLKNINLTIPEKKTTAIVGSSGSGKTTLLKLLLGFYPPKEGKIMLGYENLGNYSQSWWRGQCGTVMQNGFIFTDTIANNIAMSHDIDPEKLIYAAKIANLHEFIESLPLKYNTKMGNEGIGISQGQRQRLLIARAVYKNPEFILFDEATNALDSQNEKTIMENLYQFFQQRTVVIVAHRLSTVKNAHQIIVINEGQVTEIGNHVELTASKGFYFHLVKNQLELES